MATEVKLPKLGQTMEEGTIVACKFKVGDEVKKGDVIFEIETDKATLEMESPAGGFVKRIAAQVGQTLPVGDVILILGDKNEVVDTVAAKSATVTAAAPSSPDKKTTSSTPAAQVQVPASVNVIRLPQLGQTMEEGTIVACKVKVGDEVKKGDVIFEVETDKATLEMESPAGGFVKYIPTEVGQTLRVGEPIMILANKDTELPQGFINSLKSVGAVPAVSAQAPPTAATPVTEPVKSPAAKPAGRVIVSPRAKKLAEELNVDLSTITGTGPAGKITEQDVEKAAASKLPKSAAPVTSISEARLGSTVPLNKLQKLTAERMLKSKREIPCFYLTVRADVTNLVELRTKMNEGGSVKIAYNDFIIKAVATGLEKFPIMTGQLVGDAIKTAESINVGLAMSVPDGLIVPVIKDANKKNVVQIARDSNALIEKARSNKLLLTDLEGGTITVSNLGAFGIDSFIPIVVPGQCSILGVGQISDTCVPDGDNIKVRKLMSMTLSVDHKVANGAYAAQFLDSVRKLLEDASTFLVSRIS